MPLNITFKVRLLQDSETKFVDHHVVETIWIIQIYVMLVLLLTEKAEAIQNQEKSSKFQINSNSFHVFWQY